MATSSLGALGVAASYKVPAVLLQILFGAGVNSAGGGPRKVLLYGAMTSAGTATPDTEIKQILSKEDAAAYFGTGSELALMAAAAVGIAPSASIYGIAVAAPSGAAATGTITLLNAATGSGNYTLWIHGKPVSIGVVAGAATTAIALQLRDAINGKASELNVTATAAGSVVTVLARHVGSRGNRIALRQLKDTLLTGTTFTLSGATLSGGSGTESLSGALTTAATGRSHYYALPLGNVADDTALKAVQAQLDSMSGPLVGKRQVAIVTSNEDLTTATSEVTAINDPLMQFMWHPSSEDLQGVVSAAWASYRSVAESQSLSVALINIDMFPWIMPQASAANYVTSVQANAALNVGLTPIVLESNTSHPLVLRSITSHSLDSLGNPDTRTLDTVTVTVTHGFADEIATQIPSAFPSMRLADDPLPGEDPPGPGVVTPSQLKSFCYSIAKDFEARGDMLHVDTDYESWAFNLDPNAPGRVNATMSETPSRWFAQFSAQVRQI